MALSAELAPLWSAFGIPNLRGELFFSLERLTGQAPADTKKRQSWGIRWCKCPIMVVPGD